MIGGGPSSWRWGPGGASPALARAVRAELEAYFPPEYAGLAEVVGEGRREEAKARLLGRLGAGRCG